MERHLLVVLLWKLAVEHHEQIERTKAISLSWGEYPDWPWNGIVLSAATRGGSARWDRQVAPRYANELSWSAIFDLSDAERHARFLTVGRFKNVTARWLEAAYQRFHQAEGPKGIRGSLAAKDAAAVISYWRELPNVGDKYARNIMMDVYDGRFRDGYFAVDSRIKALLPSLGYQGRNVYCEQEAFLNALATEVGIESWQFDRLLYQAHEKIAAALR